MGKLRWYKRDPVAALEGMSNLSLEERGAYNTVLDLIYARDGAVDDDDRFIAGWLRCDVRVWKRIKARLLELGKLYVEAGALRNKRADAEVDRGLSMVASAQDAGKASARKRLGVNRKIKDIEPTTVATTVSTNSTTTTTKKERTSSLRSDATASPVAPSDLFGEKPPDIEPDPKRQLFSEGKATLETLGVDLGKAGRVIGKWLKDGHGAPVILAAIVEAKAQAPPDPVPYVTAILNRNGKNGASTQHHRTYPAAGPIQTHGDAVLAGMGAAARRVDERLRRERAARDAAGDAGAGPGRTPGD